MDPTPTSCHSEARGSVPVAGSRCLHPSPMRGRSRSFGCLALGTQDDQQGGTAQDQDKESQHLHQPLLLRGSELRGYVRSSWTRPFLPLILKEEGCCSLAILTAFRRVSSFRFPWVSVRPSDRSFQPSSAFSSTKTFRFGIPPPPVPGLGKSFPGGSARKRSTDAGFASTVCRACIASPEKAGTMTWRLGTERLCQYANLSARGLARA